MTHHLTKRVDAVCGKDYLGKLVEVTIDRPAGTTHPKHKTIFYPINYGYITNTVGGDGEELDAYVLGIDYPLTTFVGRCIAVVERLEENDDKLIVVPDGQTLSDQEIEEQILFQEQYFEHKIVR